MGPSGYTEFPRGLLPADKRSVRFFFKKDGFRFPVRILLISLVIYGVFLISKAEVLDILWWDRGPYYEPRGLHPNLLDM